MNHRGPAVVFNDIEEFRARIDDPDLEVTKDSVLVLRNCGPKGYPGMGEVGRMKVPDKLVRDGVTDMLRISDSRMSGTSSGTVVLHITPEAAVGGPLSLVKEGDMIILDVENRLLSIDISSEKLGRRQRMCGSKTVHSKGGWDQLYANHVMQADVGCDFTFLRGTKRRLLEGKDFLPRWNH
jgi:dihydroxyacid dehydratase/phosphogluconate dehydratase